MTEIENNNQNEDFTQKKPPPFPWDVKISDFFSEGLNDPKFISDLVEFSEKGEIGFYAGYYTLDELKMMVNSPIDNIISQKIKRYMHLITYNSNLPGEIFREYPFGAKINLATIEFRKYLANKKNTLDSNEEVKYHIECSNFGRIKVNGNIYKPIEEKPGWLYIQFERFDNHKYPVYRIVAETWCLCPVKDSIGWQVHHISNDGYDNTPGNLIWLTESTHKKIGTPREQKIKIHRDEDEIEIKRIIEELNLQKS